MTTISLIFFDDIHCYIYDMDDPFFVDDVSIYRRLPDDIPVYRI